MIDEDLEPIKGYAAKVVLQFCFSKSGRRALRFKKTKGWLPMSKNRPQKKMKIYLNRTDPQENKTLAELIALYTEEDGMTLREVVLYALRWAQRNPRLIPQRKIQ